MVNRCSVRRGQEPSAYVLIYKAPQFERRKKPGSLKCCLSCPFKVWQNLPWHPGKNNFSGLPNPLLDCSCTSVDLSSFLLSDAECLFFLILGLSLLFWTQLYCILHGFLLPSVCVCLAACLMIFEGPWPFLTTGQPQAILIAQTFGLGCTLFKVLDSLLG